MGAECEVRYNKGSTVRRGWSRLIRTSGGVVVGLTVQPVQAWKKGRYKLCDFNLFYLIEYL